MYHASAEAAAGHGGSIAAGGVAETVMIYVHRLLSR